jgi:carbonic anhydrase
MNIIIRCSDPRINRYLRSQKFKEEYGLDDECAIIANTGGIKYFLTQEDISGLLEQLKLLSTGFKISRVILINHTDCGFYKKLGQETREQHFRDLKEVKREIRESLPRIRVDGYLVDTQTGNLI